MIKSKKSIKDKSRRVILGCIAAFFSFLFLFPTIITITNSFISTEEIAVDYGKIFESNDSESDAESSSGTSMAKQFMANKVRIKLIPDMVSLKQYRQLFVESPDYLYKFWNSVILVVPITIFQLVVALLASYSFMRTRGRVKEIIFFLYIIVMLMPYQVALVPNYLVAKWIGILNTNWAIWLPGVFSPFAVFLLTKYMRRVPVSLIESARLDGAREWDVFLKICIPLCKSAMVSIGMLIFIDYWNMVEQPIILLSDITKYPLSVFLSKINSENIGLAFAVATVYMVPSLLMFLYGEDYLVEGIAVSSGLKG